ncbi:MAG: chromate transporter [Rubrivivax sp.]|nr:chromate transporter [Rubrivivax sp.]
MDTAVFGEVLLGPRAIGLGQWLQLFWRFSTLSLLAIGGAITTVPDMQRYVVGLQGWLCDAQFSSCIAIGQAAPEPNVLLVAVIGYSVGGLAGVAATMAGTLLPSTTLALAASRFSAQQRRARGLRAFTAGLAPLTLGLLLATSWILLQPTGLGLVPLVLVLVAGMLALMLLSQRSPLWAISAGALVGALGWV